MRTFVKTIAFVAALALVFVPSTAFGDGTHKLMLDAETEDGYKCKIDAYTGGAGYCNLKGYAEINGLKVKIRGTGFVEGLSLVAVLSPGKNTCKEFLDKAALQDHARFLAWVDLAAGNNYWVKAKCQDPETGERTLYDKEAKKLQAKFDSDIAN